MIPSKLRKHRDNTPPTTQLERIRAHYSRGRKLTPTDANTLEQMHKAREFMLKTLSRVEAKKMLMEELGVKERRAYDILKLTEDFFGSSDAISRDFLRIAVHEALLKIYDKAIILKDLQAAQNALDTICRINGLNKPDVQSVDFSALQLPTFSLEVVASNKKTEKAKYIEIEESQEDEE